ncbi:hypothetical protein QJS04_geneDACA022421 [Acorus gramineus]|uniref:Uncharacterized protein n=1 Tax=Acorus gramineus TaxID=55184 RepID=A0AAV9B896_ACOGR|nr:hypothetical protein QJS04_geneDACA022421 [Acorus gramineus]
MVYRFNALTDEAGYLPAGWFINSIPLWLSSPSLHQDSSLGPDSDAEPHGKMDLRLAVLVPDQPLVKPALPNDYPVSKPSLIAVLHWKPTLIPKPRDACNSILTFLSDVLDLANSPSGEKYRSIVDSIMIPRGSTLTRILVASLTGALPISRLEEVSYVLTALMKTYGIHVLEWAKECILLIPSTAITEAECSSFLQALSEAASGKGASALTVTLEELSDLCRRNRTVQEIVQGALRPLELNLTVVPS